MIALIEINEADIENLNVGFTLYGVYNHNASAELKASYLRMADHRKGMSEEYTIQRKLQAYEQS